MTEMEHAHEINGPRTENNRTDPEMTSMDPRYDNNVSRQ